jgi:hypothetical protein
VQPDQIKRLSELAAICSSDPYKFVMAAFSWGEGTLSNRTGPETWQRVTLETIRDDLAGGVEVDEAIQTAIASGHGVGKSALVAWLILWAICTMTDARGVVTANTENQLKTKTWAELAKWHRLCIFRDLFKYTATAIFSTDPRHEKTWRIDAVPWSERNMEAFAGLHNEGRRVLLVFDEASAIPDAIWETAEGALTDANTQIIWCAFGNPTRNSGRFKACFGKFSHRWNHFRVDSRTVSHTNKAQLQAWADDYGEDSDFFRVRVKGEFPRAASDQFISSDIVSGARIRLVATLKSDPLVMGVDVARFGDDASVIAFRKGRDAREIPMKVYRGLDTMELASRVAEQAQLMRPKAIFVDEGGVGAGVVDRLKQLGVSGVIGVNFGSAGGDNGIAGEGEEAVRVANKRAEMYALLRTWLKGGAISDDPDLETELTSIGYGFRPDNSILLESKESMKSRGLSSPDKADALALTFAAPVMSGGANGGWGNWSPGYAGV